MTLETMLLTDTVVPRTTRRGALGAAVGLTALLATVIGAASTAGYAYDGASAAGSEVLTSRLGISAGDDIAETPLGTGGADLAAALPFLFETADALGVRIETASVGQGFFTADGELLSERDLDLVVTGRRVDLEALAATLGQGWEQSSVFIFHPPAGGAGAAGAAEGPMATATLPLPGGADALTDAHYAALASELSDGGHVRYAGPGSLLFVANTGAEPEAAFGARMERVRRLLGQAGVPTGYVLPGQASLVVADRERYDALIAARTPAAAPVS